MKSRGHEALSLLNREPDDAQREETGRDEPANSNKSMFVETWPEGDAQFFARALARVLVRQALRKEQESGLEDVCPRLDHSG